MYDIFSPGKLTLQNGGLMALHQNATFASVEIEGTPLGNGIHSYDELFAAFPNNFLEGGSGSITVKPPSIPAAPTNLTIFTGILRLP